MRGESSRPSRAGRAGPPAGGPEPIDPAGALQDLLAIVAGTKIADLEVEWDGGRIRLQRDPAPTQRPGATVETPPAGSDDRLIVRSGYVGVFHRDAAQPYPGIGEYVAEGARIGEVETLRIRNAVIAPADGVLAELLAEDRTPVEYGQPLAVIRVLGAE